MACDENMTPNDVVQQEMGTHGALTYVVEGIKTYIDDAHVVQHTLVWWLLSDHPVCCGRWRRVAGRCVTCAGVTKIM